MAMALNRAGLWAASNISPVLLLCVLGSQAHDTFQTNSIRQKGEAAYPRRQYSNNTIAPATTSSPSTLIPAATSTLSSIESLSASQTTFASNFTSRECWTLNTDDEIPFQGSPAEACWSYSNYPDPLYSQCTSYYLSVASSVLATVTMETKTTTLTSLDANSNWVTVTATLSSADKPSPLVTAKPPCCGECTVDARNVQVYYWPNPRPDNFTDTAITTNGTTL